MPQNRGRGTATAHVRHAVRRLRTGLIDCFQTELDMYEGSCLCGKIRYRIDSELSDFGYCHCRSCRKASGSAHAANAGVDRQHFTLLDSAGLLREYESSPGKFRAFCCNCGSPIFAYLTRTKHLIRLRLGTLDTPFTKKAKAHIFVAESAPWHRIDGDLAQFEEWPSNEDLALVGSRQAQGTTTLSQHKRRPN